MRASYDFTHERGTVVVGHVREYKVCPCINSWNKHATNESEPPQTQRVTIMCQPLVVLLSNTRTQFNTHKVTHFIKDPGGLGVSFVSIGYTPRAWCSRWRNYRVRSQNLYLLHLSTFPLFIQSVYGIWTKSHLTREKNGKGARIQKNWGESEIIHTRNKAAGNQFWYTLIKLFNLT